MGVGVGFGILLSFLVIETLKNLYYAKAFKAQDEDKLEDATRLEPVDPKLYNNRALAYRRRDMISDAENDEVKAKEILDKKA